jgi:hypothetical protein
MLAPCIDHERKVRAVRLYSTLLEKMSQPNPNGKVLDEYIEVSAIAHNSARGPNDCHGDV